MPAAAVIPAPIGYIKVVAVEKLVVVFVVGRSIGFTQTGRESASSARPPAILWAQGGGVSVVAGAQASRSRAATASTPSLRANWSAQSRLYSFEHFSLE